MFLLLWLLNSHFFFLQVKIDVRMDYGIRSVGDELETKAPPLPATEEEKAEGRTCAYNRIL